MIFLEDLVSSDQVKVLDTVLAPWQIRQPVEVIPRYTALENLGEKTTRRYDTDLLIDWKTT